MFPGFKTYELPTFFGKMLTTKNDDRRTNNIFMSEIIVGFLKSIIHLLNFSPTKKYVFNAPHFLTI